MRWKSTFNLRKNFSLKSISMFELFLDKHNFFSLFVYNFRSKTWKTSSFLKKILWVFYDSIKSSNFLSVLRKEFCLIFESSLCFKGAKKVLIFQLLSIFEDIKRSGANLVFSVWFELKISEFNYAFEVFPRL